MPPTQNSSKMPNPYWETERHLTGLRRRPVFWQVWVAVLAAEGRNRLFDVSPKLIQLLKKEERATRRQSRVYTILHRHRILYNIGYYTTHMHAKI